MKKRYEAKDTVSIKEFMEYYLEVNYLPGSKLKHCGLKSFNSLYIIGVSNDYAESNPDMVYNGNLLIVIDDFGHKGTYINPKLIREIQSKNDLTNELNALLKRRIDELKDIKVLFNELNIKLEKLKKIENTIQELVLMGKGKSISRILEKKKDIYETKR